MWVLKKQAEKQLGLTTGQIKSKLARGVWQRGRHVKVVDSQMWINLEKVQQWINESSPEGATTTDAEKSASQFGTTARIGRRGRPTRSTKSTPIRA